MLRYITFSILLISLQYEYTNNDSNWRTIPEIYSHSWMVRVTKGMETAKVVAEHMGFSSVEKVANLDNLYHFYDLKLAEDVPKNHITARLDKHDDVSWVEPVTVQNVVAQRIPPSGTLSKSSTQISSKPDLIKSPSKPLSIKASPKPDLKKSPSKSSSEPILKKSTKSSTEPDSKKSPKSPTQPDSKKSPKSPKSSTEPDSKKSPKSSTEPDPKKSPKSLTNPDSEKSPSNLKPIKKKPFKNVYCAGPENTVISTNKTLLCNDPLFGKQWFMRSCGQLLHNKKSPHDIKLIPTWKTFNVYGRGVKVIVVDDGVFNHLDLEKNFSLEYSMDLVYRVNDPTPFDSDHAHGTKCAGIIGMERNNGICGVGIAPEATIGGIKLTQHQQFVDMNQAEAFVFKAAEIDIILHAYSYTDGETIGDLSPATHSALVKGVTEGRGGKGIIYVFPAGNGKLNQDLCSCDPLLTSIYTITVAGARHDGKTVYYSEQCANILVTMYGGNGEEPHYSIPTIDTTGNDKCDETSFSGTSASSPMAAGALALLLEANPELTWREVQHILVWTSEVAPLAENPGWYKNAAGFFVSLDFGFGLMNIFEMVKLAKNDFKSIPPMKTCIVERPLTQYEVYIHRSHPVRITFMSNGCEGTPHEVNFIEHVEVYIDMTYSVRGDLKIFLISPNRTVVQLLERRVKDRYPYGMRYVFDSVHTWGEQPRGNWHLDILDYTGPPQNRGVINSAFISINGTKEMPFLMENGPRKYHP